MRHILIMKAEKLYLSSIGEDAAACAAAFGLGVELAQFCTAMNLDDGSYIRQSLADCLAASPRRIFHGPYHELTPAAVDPLVLEITRKRYRQAAEKAAELGCEKLVLHAGFVPQVYFPEWFTARSIEFWGQMMDELPESLTVCLENVMEPEPDMLLTIVNAVDHPRLRLCLDVGHANTFVSEVPPAVWLERLSPYLSHVHLHNNLGGNDLHAPLPEGSIDMEAFLTRLEMLCPEATCTLELRRCRDSILWMKEKRFL